MVEERTARPPPLLCTLQFAAIPAPAHHAAHPPPPIRSSCDVVTLPRPSLFRRQVALCSSHYALLAPAAEGLLSLLFPFVWQGAYIPVMPFNMKDVLEVNEAFFSRKLGDQGGIGGGLRANGLRIRRLISVCGAEGWWGVRRVVKQT